MANWRSTELLKSCVRPLLDSTVFEVRKFVSVLVVPYLVAVPVEHNPSEVRGRPRLAQRRLSEESGCSVN